jgi:hypothetical protein
MPPTFVTRMIRAEVADYLNASCKIERMGDGLDESFTPSPQWATVVESQPCRFIKAGTQSSSAVRPVVGQTAIEEGYRLIVAHTVSLEEKDRVTVDGVVYHVVQLELALTDKAFRSAIVQQMSGAN